MYTPTAKNLMLSNLAFATASLHTAFPGTTGQNEVGGGSPAYARKPITVSGASGGVRTLSSPVVFDVPACTVRWLCFEDTASNILAVVPNGASPIEFVVDLVANNIRSPAHMLGAGQKVTVYDGTVPPPLVQGVTYFVVNVSTDTFQLATMLGGVAIVFTGPGTSEAQISPIVEETYTAQGQHTITGGTFGLNF